MPRRNQAPIQQIEYPSKGQTYARPEFGVYAYDAYPRGSVLAGRERRAFLGSFRTLAEAKTAYPTAWVTPAAERQDKDPVAWRDE